MQVNDLTSIDPNVDYSQILPIQQKRTIAFINHFVMNTVSFLNHFAQSCESRLMELEYKLQQVEASLMILESQLSSIPHLDDQTILTNSSIQETESEISADLPVVEEEQPHETSQPAPKVAVDPRLQKFFKMLQVGVPPPAVKMKMQSEGFDPDLLDVTNKKSGTEETLDI